MNIAHLKSKILDLAVRGKLTEQRPEEGSTEELLARIREEKQRLIAEGKLKKEKPLPEITEDEIPFNIPVGWKWVRLNDIANIERGGSPRPIADFLTKNQDGVNWIKIGDTKKGDKYIESAKEKIIPEGVKYSRFVHAGDFLLTNSMSFGRPYILKINGCIHDGWLVFSNILSCISSEYLYYLLSSSFIYNAFTLSAAGSTVKNLNIDRVKEVFFPLPPLAEQKRIVEKIEAIFKQADIIEENRLVLKTAVRHTKSRVLDLAVRGKLTEQRPEEGSAEELLERIREEKQRLIAEGKLKKEKPLSKITEEEIPFDIPAGWKWCRYMDLFTHSSGKALKQSDTDGIKREYITTSNLYWNRFDLTKVRTMYFKDRELEKCTVKKGDLLLCNGGDVGRAAIWNYDYNICIQNHVSRLRPINPQIQIKYFFYLLWYYKTSGFISGKGIGISSLTVNDILSLAIPLPPLAEQKRIVEKIEQIFGTLDTIEKAVEG